MSHSGTCYLLLCLQARWMQPVTPPWHSTAPPAMTRRDFCRPERVSAVRVITRPSVKRCSSAEAWLKPVLARWSTQISEQEMLTACNTQLKWRYVKKLPSHPTFGWFSSGATQNWVMEWPARLQTDAFMQLRGATKGTKATLLSGTALHSTAPTAAVPQKQRNSHSNSITSGHCSPGPRPFSSTDTNEVVCTCNSSASCCESKPLW